MLHLKYLHRSSFIKDSLWLVGINLFFFIIFASYDFFEWLIAFVEKYEYLELDELLPLFATLTISLLCFTYRRMVELGEVSHAFEQLAKNDPLTQVLNRRAGQALLTTYHLKAEKNKVAIDKHGFSLLQLDLDNFKRINDLYGATIGDDILLNMTRLIYQYLPEDSHLIRWHSDNFLIVLSHSISGKVKAPFEFANHIRTTIEQQLFKADPITCSIGLTSWQAEMSVEDMLHEVEDALLDAKASNKNTVKVA